MKYKYLLILFFSILLTQFSYAADGDITMVQGHDAVDMTWYGGYDEVVAFPDGSKNYRKILMHYTLGCASSQCSDWDYTTSIRLMHNTGVQDSTIALLDTLSTSPLMVDTTWNVFDVLEPYELGRAITPYGGYMANNQQGFSNAWNRTYTYDVTDFAPKMKNDVILRAFYDGWSAGFSVTINFEFVEGPSSRDIIDIVNYRRGKFGYNTSTEVEAGPLAPKDYTFSTDVEGARIRVTTTGHGFDNNVNCAEFCSRWFRVMTNGTNASGNTYIWNDNCGENGTWPQGGTWIYNRAGWCPGERGVTNEFELTSNLNFDGSVNVLDVDMQPYTWSGTQEPSYYMDIQLVSYGAYNNDNDLAIVEITNPSMEDEYQKFNPACNSPKVMVKNMGGNPVNTIKFFYGIGGSSLCEYDWNGIIAPSESLEIEMPSMSWVDVDEANPTFLVQAITVNGTADEYELDNIKEINVELPERYDVSAVVLNFRTNNNPSDNNIAIYDADGNAVYDQSLNSYAANTVFNETVNLSPGCYELRVTDTGGFGGGGDGLSHWNSNQGNGYFNLRDNFNNYLETFNADFGHLLHHQFVIGANFNGVAGSCILLDDEDIIADNEIRIYPNPSNGLFQIELSMNGYSEAEYFITDISGKNIRSNRTTSDVINLDMTNQPNGIYFIRINTNVGYITKELVITK